MVDPYEYTDSILKQWGPGGTAYQGGRQLPAPGDPRKVFVSHGHDDKAKADVTSFLESCGLEPIVLADQPSGGRAILEKFEAYRDVGFATVLLTADDLGRAKSDTDLQPRARQNVIMEMGYFMAKLGRGRVCVLLQVGVEIPSNILGIVTIGYPHDSEWPDELRRELKYAGLKLRS
ncbi:putative nucleotide-binding protein [Bradyrhizobium sp. AZCC 1678]|uniref:Nucleotide-binding protein n=1 Tax=Bradyrhizobium algeriense TaxID=634784 RepID=A0ABU8BCG9_9BRAD